MPSKYLPKMKIGTAKNLAKNLLSTKSGKQVSATAFKKFIKQDKDLKKFGYASDKSTVTKFQAKKILGQVAKDAAQSEKYKVSRFAQKLGIKQSGDTAKVSDIALDKAYQHGANEELKTEAPKGPSKEQLRREKRHEEAMKSFHKRDRADEISKENAATTTPPQKQSPGQRVTAPITHAGPTGLTPPGPQKATGLTDQVSAGPSSPSANTANRLPIIILPIQNLSGSAENIDWVITKIERLITQTLTSLRIFSVAGRDSRDKAIQETRVDIDDIGSLRLVTKRSGAQLCVFGTIQKIGQTLNLRINMLNTDNDRRMRLVDIREETIDLFNLERKITWQITHALQEGDAPTDQPDRPTPPSQKAIDLPI